MIRVYTHLFQLETETWSRGFNPLRCNRCLNRLNLANHLLRAPQCFWYAWGKQGETCWNILKCLLICVVAEDRVRDALLCDDQSGSWQCGALKQPWTPSVFAFSQAKLHNWWPTCGHELSAADMFFCTIRMQLNQLAPQAGTEQYHAALAGCPIFFAVFVHPIDKGYDWHVYHVYNTCPCPVLQYYVQFWTAVLPCTPRVASWSPFTSQLYAVMVRLKLTDLQDSILRELKAGNPTSIPFNPEISDYASQPTLKPELLRA